MCVCALIVGLSAGRFVAWPLLNIHCIWSARVQCLSVPAQRTGNLFRLARLFSLVQFRVLASQEKHSECMKSRTEWVYEGSCPQCCGSGEVHKAGIKSIIAWNLTSSHIQWGNYPQSVLTYLFISGNWTCCFTTRYALPNLSCCLLVRTQRDSFVLKVEIK